MKRWNIKNPDGCITLYYMDLATAKKQNPKAISINECTDYSYLEYVDKIISSATEALYNYKGKLVYKIPYNSAYVLVQLLYDVINGKPFYYDGLQFQSHDVTWVLPITWEISNPKEFWERFMDDTHVDLPITIISFNELKSLKPTKFWFKNKRAYYKDKHGYFYYIDKYDLPNKKSREEFEVFKGNEDAVLASVNLAGRPIHIRWYSSEREFLDKYNRFCAETPASHGTASYTIKKRGYSKKAPEDRGIAFRLPYFRLDNELEYESCTFKVASKWCALMQGYKQFGSEPFMNLDWVQDLIKRWVGHKESVPKQNDGNAVFLSKSHLPSAKS